MEATQAARKCVLTAKLLSSTQAKIEAFVEWAWDYFRAARGDAILDRVDEGQINWNDDAESATSISTTPPERKGS